MTIATDSAGNTLDALDRRDEASLSDSAIPCPLALVNVTSDAGVLVGQNAWHRAWELPGGMLEVGETPRDAAVRELDEETGIRVNAGGLAYEGAATITLTGPPPRRELAAIYSVALPDGATPTVSDELTTLRWIDPGRNLDLGLDAHIAAWVVGEARTDGV